MISTLTVKRRLFEDVFSTGDPGSEDVVLMVGSCRGVPHLNFLNKWNEENGQPFLIYYIDPFDFNWDIDGNRVDAKTALRAAENNEKISEIIGRTTIFIHEHFGRYGMFNTDSTTEDNIYRFGMAPETDICLPNFHDRFILFQDIINFNQAMADEVSDEGTVSDHGMNEMRKIGKESLRGFLEMCAMTSFPAFADHFQANMLKKRMFWNHNHVTNHFTVPLFRMICDRLGISADDTFFMNLYETDMFDSLEQSQLTQPDIDAHGWQWEETVKLLKP